MKFPRPSIVQSTLAEALDAGFDTVMFRHDGWPIVINSGGDVSVLYSDFLHTGTKSDYLDSIPNLEPLSALLVGARSRHLPIIHVYDIWWLDGTKLTELSFRQRHMLVRTTAKRLDPRFQPVVPHPIANAHILWRAVVKDPENFKGLVCRHSQDTAAGELRVIPYYKENPTELK